MVYLNLITCIWIFILRIPKDLLQDIKDGIYGTFPEDIDFSKIEDGRFISLPEKLKCTYNQFFESNSFKYYTMMFMNLFNIEGNDISPNKDVEFWVTCILMFIGVLILGNLIGEFTNILNEIYESDFNNEIEEYSKMI